MAEASRDCGTPSVVARCLEDFGILFPVRGELSAPAAQVGEPWLLSPFC